MSLAILTDTTKCIGCHQCVIACKKVNNLPPELPRRWNREDGLSARNWTSIVEGPDRANVRKQCRHCLEPACASACPVGALYKTAEGPVIYDAEKCMGCRYCMMACPYDIPRYDWDQTVPYVRKCVMCYGRVKAGGQPACTEACPAKATIFGRREDLIDEAHRRIHANPERYLDAVWGEREAGGTSVLYISNVDLSLLARGHKLSGEPLPRTTRAAMQAVPFAFTGVVALMAGVHWIGERRKKVSESDEQGS